MITAIEIDGEKYTYNYTKDINSQCNKCDIKLFCKEACFFIYVCKSFAGYFKRVKE